MERKIQIFPNISGAENSRKIYWVYPSRIFSFLRWWKSWWFVFMTCSTQTLVVRICLLMSTPITWSQNRQQSWKKPFLISCQLLDTNAKPNNRNLPGWASIACERSVCQSWRNDKSEFHQVSAITWIHILTPRVSKANLIASHHQFWFRRNRRNHGLVKIIQIQPVCHRSDQPIVVCKQIAVQSLCILGGKYTFLMRRQKIIKGDSHPCNWWPGLRGRWGGGTGWSAMSTTSCPASFQIKPGSWFLWLGLELELIGLNLGVN